MLQIYLKYDFRFTKRKEKQKNTRKLWLLYFFQLSSSCRRYVVIKRRLNFNGSQYVVMLRLFRLEKIIFVLPCTQSTHSRTQRAREPLQAVPLLRQTMHKTMRKCGVKLNVFPQEQNKVLTRTCSYLKHKSHIGRQTECETSTHCHSPNGLWSGLLFKWVLFYLKLWATWSIKKLFSPSSQFFPWKRFPSVSSSSKTWLTLHLEPESIDIEEFCIQQTILSIFFSPHP